MSRVEGTRPKRRAYKKSSQLNDSQACRKNPFSASWPAFNLGSFSEFSIFTLIYPPAGLVRFYFEVYNRTLCRKDQEYVTGNEMEIRSCVFLLILVKHFPRHNGQSFGKSLKILSKCSRAPRRTITPWICQQFRSGSEPANAQSLNLLQKGQSIKGLDHNGWKLAMRSFL